MSRRRTEEQTPAPVSAPRWIPAYASLNTILLAFFIVLSVSMGSQRDLGYMGPGLGAFKEAFTSHGMPSILRGAKKIVNFLTWGGKYVPEGEESSDDVAMQDERIVEPPPPDLKDIETQLTSNAADVVIPLPPDTGTSMAKETVERLASAARLIHLSKRHVLVQASFPAEEGYETEAWAHAAQWSMRVAKHLAEKENVPAHQITAIGGIRVADERLNEPILELVLRASPTEKRSSLSEPPKTYYRFTR